MNPIYQVRDYVLEQAKENIRRVTESANYIQQAQQVNTSLGNIIAMERNIVMHEALKRQKPDGPVIEG